MVGYSQRTTPRADVLRQSRGGQGLLLFESAKFGEEGVNIEDFFLQGGCDVRHAAGPQDVGRGIAEAGEDLRRRAATDPAGIFSERDITNPMQVVLDVPVLSPPAGQLLGVHLFWGTRVMA